MHTLVSAEAQHGDGETAHRIALGLAGSTAFEKVGDHWDSKSQRGPSDDQDAKTGAAAQRSRTETAGGVDAYRHEGHMLDVARRLDVAGRSRMTKAEL